ncbi:hypothetical protein DFP75_105215 [Marinomonas alcarazii]|uniref:Uncharacterized protein n=1 Tax=Marinomonas alcarazii TaxID=491949 RepID=A0A318UXH5_9GAMM|nr:hypothetical protein [Marinomonas alcarazii]PYF81124.1 hypothetical protein DFP75_105215 [Marinomonas alcarazii]
MTFKKKTSNYIDHILARNKEIEKLSENGKSKIHSYFEILKSRWVHYLGFLTVNCWLVGHVAAWGYYQSIGVNYQHFANIDTGLGFAIFNSPEYLLFGVFCVIFLSPLFSIPALVGVWFPKRFVIVDYLDYLGRSYQNLFYFAVIVFVLDFCLLYAAFCGEHDTAKKGYLISYNGSAQECLMYMGELGDYQVYLAEKSKPVLLHASQNPVLVGCEIKKAAKD